jgi:hypothetical protein
MLAKKCPVPTACVSMRYLRPQQKKVWRMNRVTKTYQPTKNASLIDHAGTMPAH